MATLHTKLVSAMKNVKDRMDDPMSVDEMNKILTAIKSTGANRVEVASVIGHPNFINVSRQWADAIHAKGMFVTWRCPHVSMEFSRNPDGSLKHRLDGKPEGLYGFEAFVGTNRVDPQFFINEAVNAFLSISSSIMAGDEEAIYPERTEGIFQDETAFLGAGLPGSYADFFISLHEALKIFPWTVGLSSNNASELISQWLPGALINYAGVAVIDHYRDGDPALYESEVRDISNKYGKPVYVQEGAPSRMSTPTRAEADAYYAVNKAMELDGTLYSFGSWSGWAGNPESILDLVSGQYVLNDNGLSLQTWWGGFVPEPEPEPPVVSPVITPKTRAHHRIIVKDKSKTVIGEISNWFNLRFSDQVNGYGEATFYIPIDSDDAIKLIAPRIYEIDIAEDEDIVWSGEQVNLDVSVMADDANLIKVTCYTYMEMWNGRYTDDYIRFDQVDQMEILKQLMTISQNKTDGDFGFTFATITPTKLRDREYKKDNIMESIINMTNVIDGIDVWIDKDKVVHGGTPRRGSDKSNQFSFEWKVNVLKMDVSENFSSPGNTGYAIGATDIQSYSDTQTRHTYKLREQTISAIDVSETDTLIGKAQDLVNNNKRRKRTLKIYQIPNTAPRLKDVNLGDLTTAKLVKGRYNINSKCRILGYECVVGDVGESNITWIVLDTQTE